MKTSSTGWFNCNWTAMKYALFAVVAIGVNLASQWPVFLFFEGTMVIYGALATGTLTGLVTKYLLDRKWIFYYTAATVRDDIATFMLYTLTGVITTSIFWGTEIAFFYLLDFRGSHYVGGALGLVVGYATKYVLDRKYVFKTGA